MEFRPCLEDEIPQAIELAKQVFKSNMADQFKRLYSKENKNHIWGAFDQGQIVSLLCYYPSTYQMGDSQINVGSIGSVCTAESARSKGYASKLLSLAINQMKSLDISLAIISGSGGIYEAAGAVECGWIRFYNISVEKLGILSNKAIAIQPIKEMDLSRCHMIYNRERTRFYRSLEEFRDLFLAQTFPDVDQTYPSFTIKKHNQIVSYIILARKKGKTYLEVREVAGDREAVFLAIPLISESLHRTRMRFYLGHDDEMNLFMAGKPYRYGSVDSSLFVINRPLFLNQLESKYQVFYREDKAFQTFFDLADNQVFHKVLFGFSNNRRTSFQKKYQLPLCFGWPHGLNYQ